MKTVVKPVAKARPHGGNASTRAKWIPGRGIRMPGLPGVSQNSFAKMLGFQLDFPLYQVRAETGGSPGGAARSSDSRWWPRASSSPRIWSKTEFKKAEETSMSKHPSIPNVPLAASSRTNGCGRLALAAALLGALAVPALAQSQPAARVMPEKHFTIPPGALTPVVLKTEPDAACDLHEAGVSDPSKSMRLYGNVEGYVRLHFTPNQGAEDAHLQLDCTAQGVVTTHPVHLHIAASATDDMPAPASLIPAPAGSKIRPALTDDAARLLTDQELIAQSYPPRPDATKSPKAYARWLELASRPVTIVPPHSVSRSDISHARGVTEGPADNSHWSGFAATGPPFDYTAVSGEWNVPVVSNSC